MILATIEVPLYSVQRFTVFSLPYIILPDLLALARQCSALHQQFAVLHQFSPTLPIIWAQVAAKRFLHNPGWCPVPKKLEINIQRLNTEGLAID